jgi:hypothetical protein
LTPRFYLLSFPERIVRSILGLGAGVTREVNAVVIPAAVRRTALYQNLVDGMLRFLAENVGGATPVPTDAVIPDRFLARRTAGNAVEVLGFVAFRASPVWVLSALADLSGMGRRLIPEIADALKEEGLLEKEAEFTSVDQLLEGLERTSARVAATVNTPPLDVASLRQEWDAFRREARGLKPSRLPSFDTIRSVWTQLLDESARQGRSVFETSSLMAVSAVRGIPDGARWLTASTRVGARRTSQLLAVALLDHYRQALGELREVGYLAYARRQLAPYVRAAAGQFSPQRDTLTERLVEKVRGRCAGRKGIE